MKGLFQFSRYTTAGIVGRLPIRRPHMRTNRLRRWLWSVDMQSVCQGLARLLTAGVPLLIALQILQVHHRTKRAKTALAVSIAAIRDGRPLSVTWEPFAPELMVTLLAVSEQSGKLPEMLIHWSQHMELTQERIRDIVKLCGYPSFVLTSNMALLMYVVHTVLPNMQRLSGSLHSGATPSDVALTQWVSHIPLVIGCTVAFLGGWVWLGYWLGEQVKHPILVRLARYTPGEKLKRLHRTTQFCMLLSTLTSSGMPLIDALNVMTTGRRPSWLFNAADIVKHRLLQGGTLSAAFDGNWDPILTLMLAWAEETGDVTECLSDVHRVTSKALLESIRSTMRMMEPVVLVFLGACILATMSVVFLPMYNQLSMIESPNSY